MATSLSHNKNSERAIQKSSLKYGHVLKLHPNVKVCINCRLLTDIYIFYICCMTQCFEVLLMFLSLLL